ncbi:MAG: hypothetical protein DCC75_03695 [Proteobacteria bacterium]|nr:MAG: hypothetical protein DCC75_03695 [Pseudomonadota bacterium]
MEDLLKSFDLVPNDLAMIIFGAILFYALIRLLEKALFTPYVDLIEAREQATSGAEKTAKSNAQEAERTMTGYQARITDERVEAMRKKLSMLAAAKAEAAKIVEQAEAEAAEEIKKVRKDAADKLEALREASRREAENLAGAVLDRLKGAHTGAGTAGGGAH